MLIELVFDVFNEVRKLVVTCGTALVCLTQAGAEPDGLPAHFSIPQDTISPDGRYGVLMPDEDTEEPDKLVEMKTGKLVAEITGSPGWMNSKREMPWGDMKAKWSEDSSTLCWIHPDKWFKESYVVLKLQEGKLTWQVELMKLADREILSQTEAAAPLSFAITKLNNAGDGSAYPEGFSIDVSEPGATFLLPLVCEVTLTSNPKQSDTQPEQDGVRAWLTMTVGKDGSLSYSNFKVKQGPLSDDAAERVKAQTVKVPLIDTDLGKAMRFPGLDSKDGHYALGWTVQPTREGEAPVDWIRWDPTNPDKVLRRYDWQWDQASDKTKLPYQAVDLVLDVQTGKSAVLPTVFPIWPWKRDGWEVIARWCTEEGGHRYGMIESGGEHFTENFWLVNLSESPMQVKDLEPQMKKVVDDLLRERRPEISTKDFLISYPLETEGQTPIKSDQIKVPFVAYPPVSDEKEFQLSGMVTIRLADSTVVGASSGEKKLDPFVTNDALRKADEKLNSLFKSLLRSMPPKDVEVFRQEERDWIDKRDAYAAQAVNMSAYNSTQQVYEQARENSLLEMTKKRIVELEGRKH